MVALMASYHWLCRQFYSRRFWRRNFVFCALVISFLLISVAVLGQVPDEENDTDDDLNNQPRMIRNALFFNELDREENVDNDQLNLRLVQQQRLKLNQTDNFPEIHSFNLKSNFSLNATEVEKTYHILRNGFTDILLNDGTAIPNAGGRNLNNREYGAKFNKRIRNSNNTEIGDFKREIVSTASSTDDYIHSVDGQKIQGSIVDLSRRRNGESMVDRKSTTNVTSVVDITTKRSATNNERHHLVFLKVHKAASTTVHNIVMRFALSRSLDVMLPRTGNILSETGYLIPETRLHPFPPDLKFHVVCNHIIFNKNALSKHLKNPEETFFFGIVREPFSQFVSAFYFYLNTYKRTTLVNIAMDRPQHPIRGFLENPLKYSETPDYAMSVSFINNRMAADFGFPMWNFDEYKYNIKLIKRFLKMTEDEFHLVMVVDMFDESIVLLRRLLQWKVKDILYVKSNSLEYSQTIDARWRVNMNFTDEDRRLHKLYAPVDYAMYNHFRNILLRKLKEQPPEFMEEVKEFKHILRVVHEFCDDTNVASVSELTVPGNRWTEEFKINRSDCTLNQMNEMDLVRRARDMQVSRYSNKA